jgi:hypothetical protein
MSWAPDDDVTTGVERRASAVPDRRQSQRGGRRREDRLVPSVIATATPCVACQLGTALVMAFATDGEQAWLTYRCSECDHQFRRTIQ